MVSKTDKMETETDVEAKKETEMTTLTENETSQLKGRSDNRGIKRAWATV